MDISKLSTRYQVVKAEKEDAEMIYQLCHGNPLYYQYCPPMTTVEDILDDLDACPPNVSKDNKYYIMFKEGQQLVAVMDLILGYPRKEIAFIGFFMMNADMQKQGIGSFIVDECCQYLGQLSYKYVRLAWIKDNPQSEHFWIKNHFVVMKQTTGLTVQEKLMLAQRATGKENVMEFIELAGSRYSCRKFTDQKVSKEEIDLILRAGQLAPTAVNFQPQKIYVISKDEDLARLQNCKTNCFSEQLAMLICYNKDVCWKRSYDGKSSGDIDAAIVTTHMMLQAKNLGIGSTWVMNFMPEMIREEFNLPEEIVPVALLVMGYPAEDGVPSPRHASRKPLEETVEYL